jgi:hypothetical protein
MEAATQEHVSADPYYDELNRMFQLYLLAQMNARYYGRRAGAFEWRNKIALILTAILSTVALALILGADPKEIWARHWAAGLAGAAAIVSGTTPFFGWTDRIRDLRNSHFAYSQLFGQLEFVISEMRRAGNLSPEHIGLARMAYEAYTRIEALDELHPNQKMIDQEAANVSKAFPSDYLWTHF